MMLKGVLNIYVLKKRAVVAKPTIYHSFLCTLQLEDAQRQIATTLYENDRLQGRVPQVIPEPRTDTSTGAAVCKECELV